MLGFTLGWIGVPQERPVPQWVGRSANAPCKIISSPSLNRCLFRKTGNGNGELIDTRCFSQHANLFIPSCKPDPPASPPILVVNLSEVTIRVRRKPLPNQETWP
jgi:hypothetical protein